MTRDELDALEARLWPIDEAIYMATCGEMRALIATAREVDAKDAEIARLRDALEGLLSGSDPHMERIMWGEMPDEMTGTMTMKLGLYRAARAALGGQP